MTVYRDDLAAAQQRIQGLEAEIESLQRDRPSLRMMAPSQFPQANTSSIATVVAVVVALVVGLIVFRMTALVLAGLVAFLVALFCLVPRGRRLVVRPNEVALLRCRRTRNATWVGPGRVVPIHSSLAVESISLCAQTFTLAMREIRTLDGVVDAKVVAVLAIRKDEEGLERAVGSCVAGPLGAISKAVIENTVAGIVKGTASRDLVTHRRETHHRLQQSCRKSLHELGLDLLMFGLMDVREVVDSASGEA